MKHFIFLIVCISVFHANAHPYPYPYPADPSDDVELVPPKNTNSRHNADGDRFDDDEEAVGGAAEIPVIIIRHRPSSSTGSRRPSFIDPSTFFNRNQGGFGGFGSGFPFSGFPFSSSRDDDYFGFDNDDDERRNPVSTKPHVDEEEVDSTASCGFLCNILRGLQEHVEQLEKDLQEIAAKKSNKTGEYDVYNETYTERTLSDGSVVRINKTVIADTSDDGNSFFFHSTSFHNPGSFQFDTSDEEVEEIDHEYPDNNNNNNSNKVPAISDVEDFEGASSTTTTTPTTTTGTTTTTSTTTTTTTTTEKFVEPRISDDEKFNEVLGDINNKNKNNNRGIDDGLVTVEAIQ
jgi:hypothetical protein